MLTDNTSKHIAASRGLTQEKAEKISELNQTASALLRLPNELLAMVYDYVIDSCTINVEGAGWSSRAKLTYREPPAGLGAGAFSKMFLADHVQMFGTLTPFTRTSRQLRSETVSHSFSAHTFCFRLAELKELVPLLPQVGQKSLANMRLSISPSPDGSDPAGVEEWYTPLKHLEMLKIVEVTYLGVSDTNPAATVVVIKGRIRKHSRGNVKVIIRS